MNFLLEAYEDQILNDEDLEDVNETEEVDDDDDSIGEGCKKSCKEEDEDVDVEDDGVDESFLW